MDFLARRHDPVKVPASESGVEARQDHMEIQLLVGGESEERTGGHSIRFCTGLPGFASS